MSRRISIRVRGCDDASPTVPTAPCVAAAQEVLDEVERLRAQVDELRPWARYGAAVARYEVPVDAPIIGAAPAPFSPAKPASIEDFQGWRLRRRFAAADYVLRRIEAGEFGPVAEVTS